MNAACPLGTWTGWACVGTGAHEDKHSTTWIDAHIVTLASGELLKTDLICQTFKVHSMEAATLGPLPSMAG